MGGKVEIINSRVRLKIIQRKKFNYKIRNIFQFIHSMNISTHFRNFKYAIF